MKLGKVDTPVCHVVPELWRGPRRSGMRGAGMQLKGKAMLKLALGFTVVVGAAVGLNVGGKDQGGVQVRVVAK